MKRIYDKNALNHALLWIGLYIVLSIFADQVSEKLGIQKLFTAPFLIGMSVLLWRFIQKEDLSQKFGLTAFQGDLKGYLFFIPLAVIASCNLWNGMRMNFSLPETVLYIVSMLCVGFVEEVIFRGFLLRAILGKHVLRALFISGLTFGLGHIVNLLNGADFLPTLLQMGYAFAVGFLFAVIVYKGKSLYPCIITHSFLNASSVFAVECSQGKEMLISLILCVVSAGYAAYLLKDGLEQETDESE